MRRAATLIAFSVLLLTGGVTGQQKRPQDVDLQAAIRTETVDGNLREAIKQFEAIATKYKADRSVASQALMRMADCYQRLGDGQAQTIYERIVREFSDQPAAALARARQINPTGIPASAVVWANAKVDTFGNGTASRDGRHIAYVDWATGDLAIHDLDTGADRRLTNMGDVMTPPGTYAGLSAFSPEGDRVAFAWFNRDNRRYEVRLTSTVSAALQSSTVVYENEDVVWVQPYDWSRDGRSLALEMRRTDRTGQIALLDIHDGAVRVLKSFPWQDREQSMRFSPDGRYLALTVGQTSETTARDVSLLAVDGSREIPAIVHPADDEVLGWSDDGSQLLFWSDRNGPWDLWTLDVKDGRPAGTPRLLKSGLGPRGRFAPLGLAIGGDVLYAVSRPTASGIRFAQVDFAAGRVVGAAWDAGLELSSINQVFSYAWSENGQSLAVFRRLRPGVALMGLSIKDMTTQAVREMQPKAGECPANLRWSHDGQFFICEGSHVVSRQGVRTVERGIVRIDAASGDASYIASGRAPALSLDGRSVFLLRTDESAPSDRRAVVIERRLESGAERELIRRGTIETLRLSPEGGQLAAVTNGSTGITSLLIIPTDRDAARELTPFSSSERLDASTLFWAPDAQSVFIRRSSVSGKPTFVRVWLDGRVAICPELTLGSSVQVHPSGSRVAYTVPMEEVTEVARFARVTAFRGSWK